MAEVYIFDVYEGGDNFATSGSTLLSGLDLQKTYRAIDSVATGRIPSLFCAIDEVGAAYLVFEYNINVVFCDLNR